MSYVNTKKLSYQSYLRRESNTRHHRWDEELVIYDKLKIGDMQGVEISMKLFTSPLVGHVADDPLRNRKYLFVASTTLATRFSIEGGMNEEDAYTASDLYIQRMDHCQDEESVIALYRDMLTFFTHTMANLKKESVFSKPVTLCMDYVYHHLHQKITTETLAEHAKLNPNYLSSLFKKETGQTISQYITEQRMIAARNMLLYSDTSIAEISFILSFNTQSYFTKVFRQTYGFTPKEYRKRFYRSGFEQPSFGHDPNADSAGRSSLPELPTALQTSK